MKQTTWFPVSALLAAAVAAAVPALGEEIDHDRRYRTCLALAGIEPETAFDSALAWRGLGGGDAADHCVAAALFGLGQYAEAARRLEDLAVRVRATASFKAKLLAHAAQGWLLGGDAGRAEAVLTTALGLRPGDVDLLIDRAVARATGNAYRDAVADLDMAIATSPWRADAYVFRASARRFLDDLDGAQRDAEQALALDARHPEGLLERGIVRRLKGDLAGARRDWSRVLSIAPETATARAARANLEKMEFAPSAD